MPEGSARFLVNRRYRGTRIRCERITTISHESELHSCQPQGDRHAPWANAALSHGVRPKRHGARPVDRSSGAMSTLRRMRVAVNSELCQGHNRCYALAPELFDVDEYGNAIVLGDGEVPPELEEKARLAFGNCPEYAISIVEGAES